MRNGCVVVTALLLAGCDAIKVGSSAPPPDLVNAQIYSERYPIARFQSVGKRDFSNGTEVYVLDTRTGQVCYYFIASGTKDESLQGTNLMNCAGRPISEPL